MKKAILILAMIIVCSPLVRSQSGTDSIQQLQKQIIALEKQNSKLLQQVIAVNLSLKKLEQKLSDTSDSLAAMRREIASADINARNVAADLKNQLQQSSDKTRSDISVLDNKIKSTILYLIIAFLTVALLTVVLFSWLRNMLIKEKAGLEEKIKRTIESARAEMIKPENLLNGLREAREQLTEPKLETPVEIDQTLVLKIADEIIRIRKNLSYLDPETKGLKQIEFAAERIQDYFNEYGYEIIELLNKPYHEGMDISAKFKTDNTLEPGQKIITRIIKPQINFQGTVIQSAEVEVSLGE